jgi:MFS family permease
MSTNVTDPVQATAPRPSALLRHRGYVRWSACAQLTRLPIAMASLALTALTAARYGSYGIGAAMVSIIVLGEVVFAVPVGRLFDRIGISTGLRALLVARGLVYAGLLAGIVAHVPPAVLLVMAAVIGMLGGGLLGGLRGLLGGVVGEDLLVPAVTVNAMVVDIVIVGGPLMVAALVRASVLAPVMAMAAASVLAAPLVMRGTRLRTPGTARRNLVVPLLGWMCCAFAIGHLTSTIEVAILPLAHRLHGGPGAAALIVATLSVASVLGGLVFLRRAPQPRVGTAAVLLPVIGAGGVVVAFANSWPLMLIGTALAGVSLAPLSSISSVLAERLLPANRKAEGFSLINTAQGVGFSVGSLTVSVLSVRSAELLGVASTVIAAIAVTAYLRGGRRAES